MRYLQLLQTLIDTPIRLYFASNDQPSFQWDRLVGQITHLDDEILTFKHHPHDANALQTRETHLNLSAIQIYAIDILTPNYDIDKDNDGEDKDKP